jgi:lipoprotein-anchoring transpeptidase ErfK/SrfK
MHNPRFLLLLRAVVGASMSGGCAHQALDTQVRPEPANLGPVGPAVVAAPMGESAPVGESAPMGASAPRAEVPPAGESARPWKPAVLVKPEHDLRYRLPAGQRRALTIFIGSQTFEYVEDGQVFLSGRVSSGTAAHPTPKGEFRVLNKDINKRSGKYTNGLDENTPMPYSLQFSGPYFVHEGWVPGYADSHGCVRLDYEDARLLYDRIRVGDPVTIKAAGAARPGNAWPDVFPIF